VIICVERGADLHIARLMPLPLTVSCSIKIQIGFTFLVPAHPDRPGQRAIKRVCVCVLHSVQCSMLHGSETWPIRKENEASLQRTEMRMVRWMCGINN